MYVMNKCKKKEQYRYYTDTWNHHYLDLLFFITMLFLEENEKKEYVNCDVDGESCIYILYICLKTRKSFTYATLHYMLPIFL